MRGYFSFSRGQLRRHMVIGQPSEVSALELDDLFDESEWLEKARSLQARRWRKIKNQMI